MSRGTTGFAFRKGTVASMADGSETERTRLVTSAGLTAHSAIAVANRDMASSPFLESVASGRRTNGQLVPSSRRVHAIIIWRGPPCANMASNGVLPPREPKPFPPGSLYLVSTEAHFRALARMEPGRPVPVPPVADILQVEHLH